MIIKMEKRKLTKIRLNKTKIKLNSNKTLLMCVANFETLLKQN